MIQEIEKWISMNECEGKPAILKTLHPDKDDPEFYYQLRLEGLRFGQFGLFVEEGLYFVTHFRSGRILGRPFSSEKSAARLIFCLRKLADWKSVSWSDVSVYLKDPLRRLSIEANSYCQGDPGDHAHLLQAIKRNIPKEKEEIVEEFFSDPEAISFGEPTSSFQRIKAKPVRKEEGWGTTITDE